MSAESVTNLTLADNPIPDGSWREVALSDAEFAQIVDLLGRNPTPVELGMFGAMWSEHCGYKHSRPLLKNLPTVAPWVLQGPGENAGAVDIGDGLAVVFKVESHNHPSAVEPREGAATGVGGIVRDIFTMGARPIAILDGLRFGPLDQTRNRYLFDNVIAGIGGYGNCLGIPTVGGDLFFDDSYTGNPLVNAMCAGIVPHDGIVRAKASGVGNVVMLIGADTGRDGLHGATFASVDDPEASHRGVIQVGNPFLEKLLLEASLELLQSGEIIAMQDLGAAGLTSSSVECADRGGVGIDIDVAHVTRRESGMTAYEIMLSESQERMLLVVPPEKVDSVRAIVGHWSLHANEIGTITDDGLIRIRDGAVIEAELPVGLLTDKCPTYIRDAIESETVIAARSEDPTLIDDLDSQALIPTLLELLHNPNICSRATVYEQYDHTILTNTVVGPGGGDAAVVRIKETKRGIALSLDCNSRYCFLDPDLGAQHAVAEATRNVVCSGGKPLAITNCLNFGNPEKPSGYFQLSSAVSGMATACRALGIPVVSGNVSLYNETAAAPVFPTPMVGAVGVLEDVQFVGRSGWNPDQIVVLIGNRAPSLGGSEYAAIAAERSIGRPPALDLDLEMRVQTLVQGAIADGLTRAAHDVSLGGLATCLAEMAIAGEVGASLSFESLAADRNDSRWFGEMASAIVLAVDRERLSEMMARAEAVGVATAILGETGGDTVTIDGQVATVAQLTSAYRSDFVVTNLNT